MAKSRDGKGKASEVTTAAIALDLMLGELLGLATSQATEQRYGTLVRAIAPKRRNDAKPAAGSAGDGAGANTEAGKGDAAAPSAAGSTSATAAAEPKNGAAGPAAQA